MEPDDNVGTATIEPSQWRYTSAQGFPMAVFLFCAMGACRFDPVVTFLSWDARADRKPLPSDAQVPDSALCGNGRIDQGEDCDGLNLNGRSCVSLGYYGGTLECKDDCLFDRSDCEAHGRCGDGRCDPNHSEDQTSCPADCGVRSLSLGGEHTCALTGDGTVYCWGNDMDGQLGDGQTDDSSQPVKVRNNGTVSAISAGANHTCAVLVAGAIDCWGDNFDGQLGDGTTTSSLLPTTVTDLTDAVLLSCGSAHTCATDSNAHLWCWGDNFHGQLGDGTQSDRTIPYQIPNLGSVVSVAAGGAHTCVVTDDGSVSCWGANDKGQAGQQDQLHDVLVPTTVPLSAKARVLAAGKNYTCALDVDGKVWCWGANESGQLGSGDLQDTHEPSLVQLSSGHQVKAISCGTAHTCALEDTGKVWCWGANLNGQLGNPSAGSTSSIPVAVTGLPSPIVTVACGGGHTCALDAQAHVWCWGFNMNGQVGRNPTTDVATPVRVDIP